MKRNYVNPDTKLRLDKYREWSVKLTSDAVDKLLDRNDVKPGDVSRVITVSCTGFFAHGLDYELINKFNISKSVKRTHIGFIGCASALVGVNSVWETLSLQNEKSAVTLL